MRKNIWIVILIIFLGVAVWGCAYSLNKYNKALEKVEKLEKENEQLKSDLTKAEDKEINCKSIETEEKKDKEKSDDKTSNEEKDIVYPDFTTGEYELKDVQAFCDKYGLKLEVSYNEPDGTQIPSGKMPKENTVFVQIPASGEKVVKGDTLEITIARY